MPTSEELRDSAVSTAFGKLFPSQQPQQPPPPQKLGAVGSQNLGAVGYAPPPTATLGPGFTTDIDLSLPTRPLQVDIGRINAALSKLETSDTPGRKSGKGTDLSGETPSIGSQYADATQDKVRDIARELQAKLYAIQQIEDSELVDQANALMGSEGGPTRLEVHHEGGGSAVGAAAAQVRLDARYGKGAVEVELDDPDTSLGGFLKGTLRGAVEDLKGVGNVLVSDNPLHVLDATFTAFLENIQAPAAYVLEAFDFTASLFNPDVDYDIDSLYGLVTEGERRSGAEILDRQGWAPENRLLAGIAGFGLEVAVDPLSYLNPAFALEKAGWRGAWRAAEEAGDLGLAAKIARNKSAVLGLTQNEQRNLGRYLSRAGFVGATERGLYVTQPGTGWLSRSAVGVANVTVRFATQGRYALRSTPLVPRQWLIPGSSVVTSPIVDALHATRSAFGRKVHATPLHVFNGSKQTWKRMQTDPDATDETVRLAAWTLEVMPRSAGAGTRYATDLMYEWQQEVLPTIKNSGYDHETVMRALEGGDNFGIELIGEELYDTVRTFTNKMQIYMSEITGVKAPISSTWSPAMLQDLEYLEVLEKQRPGSRGYLRPGLENHERQKTIVPGAVFYGRVLLTPEDYATVHGMPLKDALTPIEQWELHTMEHLRGLGEIDPSIERLPWFNREMEVVMPLQIKLHAKSVERQIMENELLAKGLIYNRLDVTLPADARRISSGAVRQAARRTDMSKVAAEAELRAAMGPRYATYKRKAAAQGHAWNNLDDRWDQLALQADMSKEAIREADNKLDLVFDLIEERGLGSLSDEDFERIGRMLAEVVDSQTEFALSGHYIGTAYKAKVEGLYAILRKEGTGKSREFLEALHEVNRLNELLELRVHELRKAAAERAANMERIGWTTDKLAERFNWAADTESAARELEEALDAYTGYYAAVKLGDIEGAEEALRFFREAGLGSSPFGYDWAGAAQRAGVEITFDEGLAAPSLQTVARLHDEIAKRMNLAKEVKQVARTALSDMDIDKVGSDLAGAAQARIDGVVELHGQPVNVLQEEIKRLKAKGWVHDADLGEIVAEMRDRRAAIGADLDNIEEVIGAKLSKLTGRPLETRQMANTNRQKLDAARARLRVYEGNTTKRFEQKGIELEVGMREAADESYLLSERLTATRTEIAKSMVVSGEIGSGAADDLIGTDFSEGAIGRLIRSGNAPEGLLRVEEQARAARWMSVNWMVEADRHADSMVDKVVKFVDEDGVEQTVTKEWDKNFDVMIENMRSQPDGGIGQLRTTAIREGWAAMGGDLMAPKEWIEGMMEITELKGLDSRFFRAYDRATNAFKAAALLPFGGGVHSRNLFGGMIANHVADLEPDSYMEWWGAWRKYENARHGSFKVFGMSDKADHEAALAKIKDPVHRDWVRQIVESGGIVSEGQASEIQSVQRVVGKGKKLSEELERAVRAGQITREEAHALQPSTAGKVRGALNKVSRYGNPFSVDWVVYDKNFTVFNGVENMLRGALAWDTLKKGGNIDDALHKVWKYQFNYDDLSTFERSYARRVIPFYTWMRKIVPLMAESAFTHPRAFARFGQLKANLEYGLGDTFHQGWYDESLFVHYGKLDLPFGISLEDAYFFPELPYNQLAEMSHTRSLLGNINPFLRSPFEAYVMKERLFDRTPIGDGLETVSDAWTAVPGLMNLLELVGVAEKNLDGEWLMRENLQHVIADASPIIGRMRRAAPPPGKDGENWRDKRQAWFIGQLLGVSVQDNTLLQQRNALYQQGFAMDDIIADLEAKGHEVNWREFMEDHPIAVESQALRVGAHEQFSQIERAIADRNPFDLNPFELDVQARLEDAGMMVIPQYAQGSYRVDFAVVDPEHPEKVIMAVEADGAGFHSSKEQIASDRKRQRELEQLGWRFVRLDSTAFFEDKDKEIDMVRATFERMVAEGYSFEPEEQPPPGVLERVS
jgi:very-short-patch-repair endonuclease